MNNLKLSSISGKKILTMKVNENQQQLVVSHLESGTYLIEIEAEGRFFVRKLVVE
jgi:hypothetical protein